MQTLEKEKEQERNEKAKVENETPVHRQSDPSHQSHLQPKGLDFDTPLSSSRKGGSRRILRMPDSLSAPAMPLTPSYSEIISDVDSISSESTSVTPDMNKLTLGRGRGRPRKQLVKPTMDDFPLDGTDEEQRKYICRKRTEMWHYNKLCGSDSVEYRKSEINRVKSYNIKKKIKEEPKSDESGCEHKKQLSRDR